MNPFNRLPGSHRAPSGLEWRVLKRIPSVLLAVTLGCAGFIALVHWGWFELDAGAAMLAQYSTVGMWLSFFIMSLTLALFCAIVVVMKGPAYVWDAYPLPDEREGPGQRQGPVRRE